MKRSPMRKKSISEVSLLKQGIQDAVRAIVIKRDRTCILADVNDPPCNGYRNDGKLILQADHLITRSNSATFSDTRLIVCVCKGHHGWKSVGSNMRKRQYDDLVRARLSPERVALWDRAEEDSWKPKSMGASDWKLELLALNKELKQYESRN